jgi:hypothetical protein
MNDKNTNSPDPSWKRLDKAGGICAILYVLFALGEHYQSATGSQNNGFPAGNAPNSNYMRMVCPLNRLTAINIFCFLCHA